MAVTIKQIMNCITNPVKTKILIYLHDKGSLTAKELLNATSDIPQATLYRALKSMATEGIINIVSETKVRAIVEKTYALSKDVLNFADDSVKKNDGEAYFKIFSNFLVEILAKFETYTTKEDIDLDNDGTGFSATPIYATNEELIDIHAKIMEILAPSMVRKSEDQKLYTLVSIITPPEDEEID